MLVDRPDLVRVRLELARAFFYKGDDSLSKEHFERVLAGNPPKPVVANVQTFLNQIRARRRWRLHLGFSLAPDTNIGGTSDERTIYLPVFGQRLPFQRNATELTKSGLGLWVWGGGEYQYPLGQRVRLRLGMDGSRREYSGGRFDRMWLSTHAGPRIFATRNTDFSVLGSFRYFWSADQPDYVDQGARLSAGHRLGRRVTLNAGGSWHERRYHKNRPYLDGPVWSSFAGLRWVVTPTIRLDVTAGYGRDRPEQRRSRNESKWVQTGVSVALPKGFTVGAGGGYHADSEDPVLNYGNRQALDLWEMDWAEFTATPSRLTAEPVNRGERADMLRRVASHGFVTDYRGVRISRTGRRFLVERATVWNVVDEGGRKRGQAASFSEWTPLAAKIS